uniref:Beta-arrestin-1 n=1 Tax=Hucho hucho TaxID=62062 RepID=A0A4W5R489_9TELE
MSTAKENVYCSNGSLKLSLNQPVDKTACHDLIMFVTLTCAFRYGREDLDVLGLTFRKDLFVANIQAFPPVPEDKKSLTRLQERLIKKLGEHAHPFTFEVNVVVVVIFVFSVVGFCCRTNSVRLVIRKVQYAPEKPGPQPMAETTRQFLMSDKPLHLEASLDKEIYYHGEPISVNVHVTNNTNKTVKKMKISVRQPHVTDLVLLITIDSCCSSDVVAPSSTFCKVYTLTPFLNNNREKRGLALDGKLKHEDTNLASSTFLPYVILYYAILFYTMSYYTTLYYTIQFYTMLYYTIVNYTLLYYTIISDVILYYCILCYTIL